MPTRTRPGRNRDPQGWREANRDPPAASTKDRVDPHVERSLDEALEETFPASDPVALVLRSD